MIQNSDKLPENFTPITNQSFGTNQLPQQTLNTTIPKTSKNKLVTYLLSILLVINLSLITFLGYQYLKKQNKSYNITNEQSANVSSSTKLSESTPSSSSSLSSNSNVEWLPKPQEVQSVGFFNLIDQYCPFKLEYCKSNTDCSKLSELSDKYEPKTTYYKVGTMKSQYKGSPVYLAITKNLPGTHVFKVTGTEKDIVYDAERVSLFIKTSDNKFVVTNDYDNNSILCREVYQQNQPSPTNETTGIIYRHDLSLDNLGSESGYSIYTDPETGIKFKIKRTNHFFNESGLSLVKNLEEGYALYSNQDVKSNPIKLKTIINPAFTIKLPTGLAVDVFLKKHLIYQKGEQIVQEEYQQLIWTASEKPQPLPKLPIRMSPYTDYTEIAYISDYDGCTGTMALENISSESEFLDVNNNLIQVAMTDKGDILYDIKNKNFKIFEEFYLNKAAGLDVTYNDYLAFKPILVLKNRWGIYSMVFREDLVSPVCWGEPLIYLYPEKPTNVTVILDKVINLTKSEPAYKNKWNLIAYPNGNIYSPTEQREYPYLFWEGSAPLPLSPVAREVVKQTEVHNYFEKALTKLGLNDKEKQDFEKYWEPKLTGSPYYLISFYDANSLNQVANLHITPRPNTVIRILMDYERLETNNISFPSIRLDNYQAPSRNGFVVVEWGGILHELIH